jgi:hypothetical protein
VELAGMPVSDKYVWVPFRNGKALPYLLSKLSEKYQVLPVDVTWLDDGDELEWAYCNIYDLAKHRNEPPNIKNCQGMSVQYSSMNEK